MWSVSENWEILLKRLWVSYSLKTMYLNCDINICFRIICQDEENGNEQHDCKVSIKTLTKYNLLYLEQFSLQ